MLVSYNWLQSFFPDNKLSPPEEVLSLLVFHAFEVESGERVGNDTVFDVKILPNRAHDCLSHLGIARELAAILDWPRPDSPWLKPAKYETTDRRIEVKVINSELCSRYGARVIEGVTVGASPDWLRERLEAVGQRSINSLVDAANYAMLELGQPLHVFDADRLRPGIEIRLAEKGETLTTLDGQEIYLTPEILVIADRIEPIAVAGVKGGQKAGVTSETKNIVLEAANFQGPSVRRTSQALSLRTDAAKRFENSLSPALVEPGLEALTNLILSLPANRQAKVGPINDIYPRPVAAAVILFSPETINQSLGTTVASAEMTKLLNRLGIAVAVGAGGKLQARPPVERLDLTAPIDLVEEVGRLYGYEHISSATLPALATTADDSEMFKLANEIRGALASLGFAEMFGYALTAAGEWELANPLAEDKTFLRTDLSAGLASRLDASLKQALFDDEAIKLFEIGKVFPKAAEVWRLAIGLGYRTKKPASEELDQTLEEFFKKLGIKLALTDILETAGLVVGRQETDRQSLIEFDLTKILALPRKAETINLSRFIAGAKRYRSISPFPRIIRDVAVWVPGEVLPTTVSDVVAKTTGPLLVQGPVLFDVFEKPSRAGGVEKKSLAFRLVLQAPDRTLTDDEANQLMSGVIAELEKQPGWEVRK